MPETKKRKKNYYITSKNKRPRTSDVLKPGKQGFVVTCSDPRERKDTVMEAYRILNEYADKKYGPENIVQNNEDEEDLNIEDALQKEVSDIRTANSKGAERRFQNLPTKSKSVIFINANIEDSPSILLDEIYLDLIDTQIKRTKHCLRFLPVVCTCYAKTDEIIKFVKQTIEPVFVEQKEHEIIKFSIVWKTRCNNSVKRDDVLPPILDFIFSKVEHVTDYNNPEIVVNIDIIGNICCIGLLKNFVKFKKYNIDLVVLTCEKDVEESIDKDGEESIDKDGKESIDKDGEKSIDKDEEESIDKDGEKVVLDANGSDKKEKEELVEDEKIYNIY